MLCGNCGRKLKPEDGAFDKKCQKIIEKTYIYIISISFATKR